MSELINRDRRTFLANGVVGVAAAQLGASSLALANPAEAKLPLKQIDAGLLNVGYAEAGPADGRAVVLLHGWPYDIHSFVDVVPLLASAGYRVITPYLRGYGTTRFLSGETFRNGQQSAVALDTIALMDALQIRTAIVAGFDWGARTANIVAALWPQRCKGLVSVSGYLVGNPAAGKVPLRPAAELQSIRITSASWSTTIAGDWASRKASRSTTIWKSSSPRDPPSPFHPSLLKVMPMARRTRTPVPMPGSSRASMRIGS